MQYLHWKEEILTDFSPEHITAMYERGFVFTRIGKGVMHQTRSCRIDLGKFELSSENRRILKKTAELTLGSIPLPMREYDFKVAKLAKDFYDAKFGPGIMSANKVKEILTDPALSNFNLMLCYILKDMTAGYSICYSSPQILHYSYPFYDLNTVPRDTGLGMMIRAIEWAKNKGLKHVYLGSLQRPTDTYKLQFSGLEWFDGTSWHSDTESLKEILK